MSIIDISKQENTIFIPMKVFVSINPRGVCGPEFLIVYGQPNFYSTFYFDRNLPLPLNSLLSPMNDRSTISAIEISLLKGTDMNVFVTLRDRNNVDIFCHLSISAGASSRIDSKPGCPPITGRFTTITISSATKVDSVSVVNVVTPIVSTTATTTATRTINKIEAILTMQEETATPQPHTP